MGARACARLSQASAVSGLGAASLVHDLPARGLGLLSALGRQSGGWALCSLHPRRRVARRAEAGGGAVLVGGYPVLQFPRPQIRSELGTHPALGLDDLDLCTLA